MRDLEFRVLGFPEPDKVQSVQVGGVWSIGMLSRAFDIELKNAWDVLEVTDEKCDVPVPFPDQGRERRVMRQAEGLCKRAYEGCCEDSCCRGLALGQGSSQRDE